MEFGRFFFAIFCVEIELVFTDGPYSLVASLALTLGCPLGRRRRAFVVLVEEPVLLRIIQWVDHLRHKLVLLCDLQHITSVLVTSTVIGRGEDGEQLTSGEALKSVHDTLMGT